MQLLQNPYIIAEAGCNHNGSLKMALDMVDIAKHCGADAVKFQAYKTGALLKKRKGSRWYQNRRVLKKCELTLDDFKQLKARCDKKKIEFLASVFDMQSLKEIISLGVPALKWASPVINDYEMLEVAKQSGLFMIISVGIATDKDIEKIINEILLNNDFALLHCVSEYPAKNARLDRIAYLKDRFQCQVGYSDHTEGIEVAVMAADMGAEIIEKHFTISRQLNTSPDHWWSIEPKELKEMIGQVRIRKARREMI